MKLIHFEFHIYIVLKFIIIIIIIITTIILKYHFIIAYLINTHTNAQGVVMNDLSIKRLSDKHREAAMQSIAPNLPHATLSPQFHTNHLCIFKHIYFPHAIKKKISATTLSSHCPPLI
jgi:flagellar basal body-associated protein FliL